MTGSPLLIKQDSFLTIPHFIFAIFLLINGSLVGRIHIHMKHFPVFFIVAGVYLVWYSVHVLLEMGKGDSYQDPIYPIWDLKKNLMNSLILFFIVLFVLHPLLYAFLWMLSMLGYGCGSSKDCFARLDDSHQVQCEDYLEDKHEMETWKGNSVEEWYHNHLDTC